MGGVPQRLNKILLEIFSINISVNYDGHTEEKWVLGYIKTV